MIGKQEFEQSGPHHELDAFLQLVLATHHVNHVLQRIRGRVVRIVVVVVCTKVEDGLCAKVAEGDVVGSTEGVLVDVHHKIGVVFPMLVASCAVGPVNAEVHRSLQDVPMHVVKDAGDGDVLLIGVDVGARPCVVGVRFTGGLDGRP